MDKILIKLEVPSVHENYDLFAPTDLSIEILTKVLADGVNDLAAGRYGLSGKEMLMQRNPDKLLNPQKTLADYDIRDGVQLMIL